MANRRTPLNIRPCAVDIESSSDKGSRCEVDVTGRETAVKGQVHLSVHGDVVGSGIECNSRDIPGIAREEQLGGRDVSCDSHRRTDDGWNDLQEWICGDW